MCHHVTGDVMTRAPARAVLPLLCCGVVAVVVSRASEVYAHLRMYSTHSLGRALVAAAKR